MSPRPSPYPPREPRLQVERQPAPDLLATLPALGVEELNALIEAAALAGRWMDSPDLLGALERGRAALEAELLGR